MVVKWPQRPIFSFITTIQSIIFWLLIVSGICKLYYLVVSASSSSTNMLYALLTILVHSSQKLCFFKYLSIVSRKRSKCIRTHSSWHSRSIHFQVEVQWPKVKSFLDPKPMLWAWHLGLTPPPFFRFFGPEIERQKYSIKRRYENSKNKT